MPSVPLFPQHKTQFPSKPSLNAPNPLPTVLQTPSGLAILELQGTINVPPSTSTTDNDNEASEFEEKTDESCSGKGKIIETELGKLMFPDYIEGNPDSTKWMKRAYLYVGQYQRMTGEVKKLAKPLAVIQRRQKSVSAPDAVGGDGSEDGDELEIVEIIKYKIIFASRPEPVGLER